MLRNVDFESLVTGARRHSEKEGKSLYFNNNSKVSEEFVLN